jgi:hypothetical protein
MQFTRIRKTATLLEIYFCAEAPEKNQPFAMWPLAMEGGGAGPNYGAPVRGLAGKGGERG